MLRPRGRLQVHTGLPRALLLYGGHAGGRGLAQVEGDAGCALRGRAADGAGDGRLGPEEHEGGQAGEEGAERAADEDGHGEDDRGDVVVE